MLNLSDWATSIIIEKIYSILFLLMMDVDETQTFKIFFLIF